MAQTLSEKLTFSWIAIAVLGGSALILRWMGVATLPEVAVVLAILVFVFGVLPIWARSISGQETADEAEARQAKGGRAAEGLAAEEATITASAKSDDPSQIAYLMSQYGLQWVKTSNPIPNGLVAGSRASPVDIYDGDFALLAKEREMMARLVSIHRNPEKWTRKLAKLDSSIGAWRKGAEEIRDGIREAPDHFNAEDYLRRLDSAFPAAEEPIVQATPSMPAT